MRDDARRMCIHFCPLLNPLAFLGAVNAIQDAICLGNWINTLPKTISTKELRIVFQDYLAERLPIAKENFAKSQFFASLKENVNPPGKLDSENVMSMTPCTPRDPKYVWYMCSILDLDCHGPPIHGLQHPRVPSPQGACQDDGEQAPIVLLALC